MIKRFKVALAVLAMATGFTLVAATPAQAHDQWGCGHGLSCLFLNIDGGGWIYPIAWSANPKDTCVNLSSFYRNQASSIVVDFGNAGDSARWDINLYENLDCTDTYYDAFNSPTHKNFVWCNTCNSLAHLNDDVEAFKIVCRGC